MPTRNWRIQLKYPGLPRGEHLSEVRDRRWHSETDSQRRGAEDVCERVERLHSDVAGYTNAHRVNIDGPAVELSDDLRSELDGIIRHGPICWLAFGYDPRAD